MKKGSFNAVGHKIKQFREERGLTLKELAPMVNLSYSFLSALERGTKKPSLPTLKKIAQALNVPVSYLVADTDENTTAKKLKFIREGRSLSIEDLAELSGITAEQIEAIEQGTLHPDMDTLEKLADSLGVTIRYFLERISDSVTLGTRLRKVREEKGITVTDLAEKAGVSPGLISQIEQDQTIPSLDTLENIARALGSSICYFLLEQENVTDLISSMSPDLIELLSDPRVQAVLRAVRDFTQGELRFVLNQIHFFKRYRDLL